MNYKLPRAHDGDDKTSISYSSRLLSTPPKNVTSFFHTLENILLCVVFQISNWKFAQSQIVSRLPVTLLLDILSISNVSMRPIPRNPWSNGAFGVMQDMYTKLIT